MFIPIYPLPTCDQPILLGVIGKYFLENETILRIDGVYGEARTKTLLLFICILNPNDQWNIRIQYTRSY
jgi:hypothetical protein